MSLRMGFYTGKIYDNSVDISTIKECCQILNDREFHNRNLDKKRLELKLRCVGCNGCEESQKNM